MEAEARAWLSLPLEQRQQLLEQLVGGQNQTNYINLVSAGELGVFASLGQQFDFAVFGRDSLQVAEDLLITHKPLVDRIIATMIRFQGVTVDNRSEEEPGKIHHEYRARIFSNYPVPGLSINIMKGLQRIWGDETSDEICYYGSYDATPQFIRLMGRYAKHYGNDFLNYTCDTKSGEKPLKTSLRLAMDWLVGKIESSDWQLFEYKRLNVATGISNQAWKDSSTSYLHIDGEVANYDGGIASVELQGLAYDALKTGADLVSENDDERQKWLDLATKLQEQTIARLWMEDQQYFAQGLDRGLDGQARPIKTLTSNPGGLLDSQLLSDLPNDQRQKYVEAIAALLNSTEFRTSVGIRCRALRHKQMPGFVDYHGSYTVWPKETFTVARGLRRHGLPDVAAQLETTIASSVVKAGEFYEFFYVNDDDHVWYNKDDAIKHFQSIGLGNNLAVPEPGQAWTISAVLAILRHL